MQELATISDSVSPFFPQSVDRADGCTDAVVTGSGNSQIYHSAGKPLIRSCMEGFDAVIFAYGQTASGKTFTLVGLALLVFAHGLIECVDWNSTQPRYHPTSSDRHL